MTHCWTRLNCVIRQSTTKTVRVLCIFVMFHSFGPLQDPSQPHPGVRSQTWDWCRQVPPIGSTGLPMLSPGAHSPPPPAPHGTAPGAHGQQQHHACVGPVDGTDEQARPVAVPRGAHQRVPHQVASHVQHLCCQTEWRREAVSLYDASAWRCFSPRWKWTASDQRLATRASRRSDLYRPRMYAVPYANALCRSRYDASIQGTCRSPEDHDAHAQVRGSTARAKQASQDWYGCKRNSCETNLCYSP